MEVRLERRDSDCESTWSQFAPSRPTSPGSSAARPEKRVAKPKPKQKVKIHDDVSEMEAKNRALQRRCGDLEYEVAELKAQLQSKSEKISGLEHELSASKDKHSALLRSNAKRLLQITTMGGEIDREKNRNRLMLEEVVKQTKMLDLVMSFRDKESAKDYHELIHENVELGERCERWKERAEMLQQERWGFVAKWREGKMAGLSLAQGRKVDLDHHPADAGEEEAAEEPPSDSSSDDEPADDSDSDL